jgi:hypothetical protein
MNPLSGFIGYYLFNKKVDTLASAVRKIIERAESACLTAIGAGSSALTIQQIQALNNATHFLQNLQIVYASEMSQTVEKVSEVVQKSLAQADTLVHGIIEGMMGSEVQRQLQDIKAMTQSFLTLMQGRSVLTATSPNCVSPFPKRDVVVIQCSGFFPHAANPRLAPSLELKGQTFLFGRTVGPLACAVPYDLIFSPGDPSHKSVGYTIKIPYLRRGYFINTIGYSEYRENLALLPNLVGKIVLEYTVFREEREERWIPQSFSQSSKKRKEGGEECTIIDRPHTVTAPAGWSIVPGSVSIHMGAGAIQGKGTTYRLISEGPVTATAVVTTHKHKHNRDSGSMVFDIRATAFRVNKIAERKKEEIHLNWGESMEISPEKKEWKITFEAPDGTQEEYNGNTDSRFISIRSPRGNPIIKIKHPGGISRDETHMEPIAVAKL